MKFLSLAITTVVFTVVAYLLFSFTAWSFNISVWHPLLRLFLLGVVFIPYQSHIKRYAKI